MADEINPQIIAIIGAGVAGPFLALSILSNPILRQRYRPIIYESLPCPKPTPSPIPPPTADGKINGKPPTDSQSIAAYAAGAAVALTSNALYPLYSLGLQPSLDAISCETECIKIWRSTDGEGGGQCKLLNRIMSPNWQRDLNTSLRVVERGELRRCMLEKLTDLGGKVVWGMKVVDMKNLEEGGVKLAFEGGEEAVVGLVVGADGAWSNVRRHIIASKQDNADERMKPEFVGADAIYGISKRIEVPRKGASKTREEDSEELGGDTHWVFVNSSLISTWALPGGKQFWTIASASKAPPERNYQAKDSQDQGDPKLYNATVSLGGYELEETAEILRAYETIPYPIRGTFGELLRSSERIVRTPLYYRAWEEHEIGGQNVVVIGDAARLMLPTSGQGACFAIEDATVLANALLNNSSTSETSTSDFSGAIEEYVQARVPRSKRMTNQSYWMAYLMSWMESRVVRWLVDLSTTWLPTGGNPKLSKVDNKKDPMGWIYDMRYKVELRDGEQYSKA